MQNIQQILLQENQFSEKSKYYPLVIYCVQLEKISTYGLSYRDMIMQKKVQKQRGWVETKLKKQMKHQLILGVNAIDATESILSIKRSHHGLC